MNSKLELKHHKDFHRAQFQGLTTTQRNITFALCYKLMNQESNLLEFDVKDIIDLTGYKPLKKGDNIYKHLEKTYDVLKNVTIKVDKKNGVKKFVLFTIFETFEDTGKVQIKVNSEYRHLLNQVTAPFTLQNLIEYTELKSNYSQLLYSLLKEWEKKKEHTFSIEDFRNDLGVPTTYDFDTINKRVLKPILKDLPQYFPNLKLEKIKSGKKITSLKFSWSGKIEKVEPQKIDNVIDIIEIEISEQLNQAIEKAKKNRFIQKLLTIDNIEILIQMFSENDLVKGLIWAYKEVRQDVSTLNYLVKTIRTGAEKKEKKLVVKKATKKQQNIFDEVPLKFEKEIAKDEVITLDQKIEPQKISKKEYENLYKIYLKENNIRNLKSVRKGFDLSNKSKYKVVEDEPKEKIYHADELPKEKLLSKSGKELKGMPLLMRLRKLAKDMQIKIQYKDEIIKGE
ncbi:MAG: replication initiation protein [Cetobacterium sp.]|uniref:replication initiation protein n=1 Tax=Cetobacterium sp. TaxID=2071632 RepID=UPI003F31E041